MSKKKPNKKDDVKDIEEEEIDDSLSDTFIDSGDLKKMIDEDKEIHNNIKSRGSNSFILNILLIIVLISSLILFGLNIINKNTSIFSLINSLLLTIFSIMFIVIGMTYTRRKKFNIILSSLLIIAYFSLNIFMLLNGSYSDLGNGVPNFSGKSLTYAVKWANKNNIKLNQDYEFSDMIPEYSIISQDIKSNTSLKDISEITISVSEGPNPYKEVIVPNMITWNADRVINYVKDNYLSNVYVEFVESDKLVDTVIEQSLSGNMKRNDSLKLVFSYGEELGYNEYQLIDFKNMSKFEVEFFMKQHQLRYEFDEDFSDKVKKGYVIKQSINPGEMVSVNDTVIKVTISKGPKIKVPDLVNMSVNDVTEWAIKNKLKLEFLDSYDDNVKEGSIISVNVEKDSIIEEGTSIKVTISKGYLKMPKFKSLDEFRTWADKYEIKYTEEREFSDSVAIGEVISYSVKTGSVIKNDENIVVKISDGKNQTVPNLKGLTKSEAITKLKNAGLKYNFVYKNSDTTKDKVLSQSISAGSNVSSGTTITVTLSNGKSSSSSSSNSNSNSDTNTNNDNNKNTQTEPEKEREKEKEEVKCNACSIPKSFISSTLQNSDTCSEAASSIRSFIQEKCSGIKTNITCEKRDGYDTLDFISGFNGGPTDSCQTINIVIGK